MNVLNSTRRVEFDPRPQPPVKRIVRPDRPGSTSAGGTLRSIAPPAAPTLPDRAACEAALAKAEEALQEATKRADGLQEALTRATALSEALSASDEALRAAQARAFSNPGQDALEAAQAAQAARDLAAREAAPGIAAKPQIEADLAAAWAACDQAQTVVKQARMAVSVCDQWDARLAAAEEVAQAVALIESAHARLLEHSPDDARSLRSNVSDGHLVYRPLAAAAYDRWSRPLWLR